MPGFFLPVISAPELFIAINDNTILKQRIIMCLIQAVVFNELFFWHSLCKIASEVHYCKEHVMGYFVDLMMILKELVKLVFMVMISPLGIMAGYLATWE